MKQKPVELRKEKDKTISEMRTNTSKSGYHRKRVKEQSLEMRKANKKIKRIKNN